jgi:peptide/nickel transport system substrate-binding protein
LIGRRGLLEASAAGSLGALLGAAAPRSASATGRTPTGGALGFRVPWTIASLDPHDVLDPIAALFATAAFDTIFTPTTRQPALAEDLPKKEGARVALTLRGGLATAAGKPLGVLEVRASLKRAASRGAAHLVEPLGPIELDAKEPRKLFFPKTSVQTVIDALSQPLCAIVPAGFDPRAPDGSGPFAAALSDGGLTLTRNLRAASGPAFLERVRVSSASDLRESLREFEVARDDLGWLGQGLASPRAGSERFDLGAVGAFVLAASGDTPLAKPGALQRLVDRIPKAALFHLGLGALPDGGGDASNPGPPLTLFVERSAHLTEIAEALASALSAPDHEVTVKTTSRADLVARRKRSETMLALFAGRLSTNTADLLATLHDPEPRGRKATTTAPRDAAASLSTALLGELRVFGGKLPNLTLAAAPGARGWDWAASSIKKAK